MQSEVKYNLLLFFSFRLQLMENQDQSEISCLHMFVLFYFLEISYISLRGWDQIYHSMRSNVTFKKHKVLNFKTLILVL